MMHRRGRNILFLLIAFATILPAVCFSQDTKVDSLQAILKHPKDDTTRVNTLNALSKRFLQLNNIPEAKKYAGEALSSARKISFKKGEAIIHQNFGMIYTREYNFPEALKSFFSFSKISQETGNKNQTASAFIAIANTYFHQGNYEQALKNHFAALKLKKEVADKPGVIMCYNNIGLVNWNLGNYPESYKNYFAALRIREETGDQLGVAHSYNVLGVVYDDEGNYPEALKNYIASLKIYEKLGAEFGIAACNNNIGELYRKQHNYNQALKSFAAALKWYEKMEDEGGIAMSYNNIGDVKAMQANYPEARENFLNALKLYEKVNDKYGLGTASGSIATLFYKQAENFTDSSRKQELLKEALKKSLEGVKNFEVISQKDGIAGCYITAGLINIELKNFSAARKFLDDGLLLSKESGVKERIKDSYEALAKLDSATGNWEGAFKNNLWHTLYRDSLINKENTGKILQLQMQYEFGKKEDSLKFDKALINEKLKQQTLLTQQQRQTISLKEKEFALISNEKQLQQMQIEKNKAEYAAQKAEAENKQSQLVLLNKEKAIQALALKKQSQVKNYLVAGLILLGLLSFFIYYNYRTRQKLKLQLLRNKIASDLHDDVGSTLSSISIFSQMAQQQSAEVNPLLETIEDSSRKMLDAMADIVWSINPENDQFEKIISRMKSFAFELLGAKKIDFEFIADDNVASINVPMHIRKNLYLIFKEATNNMVKYATADRALFSVREEKNNLIMLIKDNGKGFDTNKSTNGNGLKNMKKRASEIGAKLIIDSMPGSGTTIQLMVAV